MTTSPISDSRISESQLMTELARFFALAADSPTKHLEMFSPAVDSAWHALLQRPAHYDRFCREATGGVRVLHDDTQGVGDISWIPAYEERFGPLNEVWFMSEDGVVDEDLRRSYLGSGHIVTAWDCTPIIPTETTPEEAEQEGEGDPKEGAPNAD